MFSRTAHSDPREGILRRFVAGLSAAVVLLLTVAVASPAVHQWLHGDNAPDAGDACAVAVFATGMTVAAAAAAVAAPRVAWRQDWVREAAEIFVATPRYLRLPERGPPLS